MTAHQTTLDNGPAAHEFLDANPFAWEVLAAVWAGLLGEGAAAEALGLDPASLVRLLRVSSERMKRLARQVGE